MSLKPVREGALELDPVRPDWHFLLMRWWARLIKVPVLWCWVWAASAMPHVPLPLGKQNTKPATSRLWDPKPSEPELATAAPISCCHGPALPSAARATGQQFSPLGAAEKLHSALCMSYTSLPFLPFPPKQCVLSAPACLNHLSPGSEDLWCLSPVDFNSRDPLLYSFSPCSADPSCPSPALIFPEPLCSFSLHWFPCTDFPCTDVPCTDFSCTDFPCTDFPALFPLHWSPLNWCSLHCFPCTPRPSGICSLLFAQELPSPVPRWLLAGTGNSCWIISSAENPERAQREQQRDVDRLCLPALLCFRQWPLSDSTRFTEHRQRSRGAAGSVQYP